MKFAFRVWLLFWFCKYKDHRSVSRRPPGQSIMLSIVTISAYAFLMMVTREVRVNILKRCWKLNYLVKMEYKTAYK
jgi:hypothetical protein